LGLELFMCYNEQGTMRNCPSRCSLIFLCCLKKTWTHSTPVLPRGLISLVLESWEASICLDQDIPKQTCTDLVSHVNWRVLMILITKIDWVVVAHFNRDSLDKNIQKILRLDLQIRMLVCNCISFQFLWDLKICFHLSKGEMRYPFFLLLYFQKY